MTEPHAPASDAPLIRAMDAWGRAPETLDRLGPEWRQRLGSIPPERASDADSARLALRRDHEAALRPDLSRVHPSWWVRALRGESSTVRRAVVAHAPAAIRERLRNELEMRRDDLAPAAPPHPDAVACVIALWSEPFVGGPPPGDDDPPVVTDVATQPRPELSRRIGACGLVKLAASPGRPEPPAASLRIRARLDHYREVLKGLDSDLSQAAEWDVRRHEPLDLASLPRLGLTTVARLLEPVDPFRMRWTIQHLPYATARLLRATMGTHPPGVEPHRLYAWEQRVWALAGEAPDDGVVEAGGAT